MRTLLLSAALAAVIAYAILFARPLESDAALAPHDPPLPREDGAPRDAAQSAYWSLERRYWRLERSAGRLGAEVRRLRRARLRPTVTYAIRLASATFGVPEREMWAVARCESAGFTDYYNEGSGASGPFQFLPGTFSRTPFAGFDIFDPVVSALAAGWVYRQDGGSWREWQCSPRG